MAQSLAVLMPDASGAMPYSLLLPYANSCSSAVYAYLG